MAYRGTVAHELLDERQFMDLVKLESLTLFITGGEAYGYNSNLYRDVEGRYLWHKWSLEEPCADCAGYKDLELASEYVASEEVYAAQMFDCCLGKSGSRMTVDGTGC